MKGKVEDTGRQVEDYNDFSLAGNFKYFFFFSEGQQGLFN